MILCIEKVTDSSTCPQGKGQYRLQMFSTIHQTIMIILTQLAVRYVTTYLNSLAHFSFLSFHSLCPIYDTKKHFPLLHVQKMATCNIYLVRPNKPCISGLTGFNWLYLVLTGLCIVLG